MIFYVVGVIIGLSPIFLFIVLSRVPNRDQFFPVNIGVWLLLLALTALFREHFKETSLEMGIFVCLLVPIMTAFDFASYRYARFLPGHLSARWLAAEVTTLYMIYKIDGVGEFGPSHSAPYAILFLTLIQIGSSVLMLLVSLIIEANQNS